MFESINVVGFLSTSGVLFYIEGSMKESAFCPVFVFQKEQINFINYFLFLKENVEIFKKLLTSYAIIFDQRTFFPIIKLVLRGKHEFYLSYYNTILKDHVLCK